MRIARRDEALQRRLNLTRVVHLTTLHQRSDNRIVKRECAALRDAGYDVHLVVADGLGDQNLGGIQVHDVGRARGRLDRMSAFQFKAMKRALELNPASIHVHDPELLFAAAYAAFRGTRMIYDSHEDLPRSIMSKEWIDGRIRRFVSVSAEFVEDLLASRMSAIVAATPVIAERFASRGQLIDAVCNYPDLSRVPVAEDRVPEPRTFVYVGALSVHRGIHEMIEATRLADARLILAGAFETPEQQQQISALRGWSSVEYLGVIPHERVWGVMNRAMAGLLFLHPVRNYIESLPTKMYEYMAMGLPTLASDYAGWPDVIRDHGLGYTCDPLDPAAIAALMLKIIDDPAGADAMGRKAREIVMAQYRWENEAGKLVSLYRKLLA